MPACEDGHADQAAGSGPAVQPSIRTNSRCLRWSFSQLAPVTGSMEIELTEGNMQSKTDPVWGVAIMAPGAVAVRFTSLPSLGEFEVHLCADLHAPALCSRSYSLAGHSTQLLNRITIAILDGTIHGADLNGEPMRDVTPYSWKTLVNHAELQKKTLEGLFGKDWFAAETDERNRHPAYSRWLLFEDILKRNIVYPDHFAYLPQIAEAMFENYVLVECTRGNVDQGLLGSLEAYGAAPVVARIHAEIIAPEKYRDVMVELMYAAWHLSKGHTVRPTDEQGTADFELLVPGYPLPIYADCKRVRRDSSERRFAHIILKANSQVKRSALGRDSFGLVVIDVSDRVAAASSLTDALPCEIEHVAQTVQRSLIEHNSSLGAAILLWNDFAVMGEPPDQRVSAITMRRRSLMVRHRRPRMPLPDISVLADIGNTVQFKVFWRSREQSH